MQRLLAALAAFIFLAFGGVASAAQAPAFIVVNAETGAVLMHSEADQPWYPASVTKLMTAYVTFQALRSGRLKLTSPVKISQHALDQQPSKMGFKVGTILNLDNALKMMLVKSANDIAVAIAETVGGNETEFVIAMNAEAARLGMASTHFNNPNGLPDGGQVTTARDLAVLARAVWAEFPAYREYFRIPAIKAGKKILRSPNALLEHFRGANGMKTGFICASGFNVVASAERNGRTLIAVVLGATSSMQRTEMSAKLLSDGFGMWFEGSRPRLANFEAGPSGGLPVNMHDQVCGKQAAQESDGDPAKVEQGAASALVPRFVLMDPVPVFTGKADPVPGEVSAPGPAEMPMPRLRPRALGDTAALPADDQPLILSNPN
jgi:D-alanyl-D-alanine carboxypeptidase